MPEDLDLVPTLWRDPDRVVQDEKHEDGLVFELDTSDGGILRLPLLRIGNSLVNGTLYKKKQALGRADVEKWRAPHLLKPASKLYHFLDLKGNRKW